MNIPYDRFAWNYKWSDENARAKALNQIDWNFLFCNRNIHEQVIIFIRALMNVFTKVNWENSIYKNFLKNGKTNHHYLQLLHATQKCQ